MLQSYQLFIYYNSVNGELVVQTGKCIAPRTFLGSVGVKFLKHCDYFLLASDSWPGDRFGTAISKQILDSLNNEAND